MLLNVTGKTYFPAERMAFHGTKAQLEKQLEQGYQIARGSNGSYQLYQPAVAQIIANVDGKKIAFDAKDEIRRIYNVKNVTKKRLGALVDSIKSGKKEAHYTEEGGLKIIPVTK